MMKKYILYTIIAFIGIVGVVGYKCISGDEWKTVYCPGEYTVHLQGIAIDGKKIYWSYSTKILRTDDNGNIEKIIDAPWHQGDCCFNDGKLYVAVNTGKFNTKHLAKNFVYVYNSDLNFEKEIAIDNLEGGLGGMTFYEGSFYLVGGIDKSEANFKICKYSKDFKLEKEFFVPVGESTMGVQTICGAYGKFWLGCYLKEGSSLALWEMDKDFNIIKKHSINASCGIDKIESKDDKARFLIVVSPSKIEGRKFAFHTAYAVPTVVE